MQKYGEIKDLVNAVLESYDKYPVIQNIDCRSRINSESVNDLLEMIRKILFPGYFEIKNLRKDSIEYHVGELLENIEYNLTKQVMMALPHSSKYREADKETLMESAREITHRFLEKIPKLRDVLATDVQAGYEGDPAAFNTDEVIFSYPGMYAITVNRIAHELYLLGVPLIPRMMTEHAHSLTGIDIHPGASIGEYFFIDHGDRKICQDLSGCDTWCTFHQRRTESSRCETSSDPGRQRNRIFRSIDPWRRDRDRHRSGDWK